MSRVGPYTLTDTLGVGTFGRVQRGRRDDTGEEVAVKILEKCAIKQQELTIAVRREIAIMKALDHDNVVKLKEVLASRTKLYIVMELGGNELFDLIDRERGLDEATARTYFAQLVDGMVYCHRRGVYHRDIKPENLLLDEHGVLKIADFGVSSITGGDLLYTAVGTPYYCAPEVLGGAQAGYSGAKVDAWSCGVLLFVMLTGSLPFHHEDPRRLLALLVQCKVPYPPRMGGAVKDLISHLLVVDPAARLSLEDAAHHPWLRNDGGDNGSGGGGGGGGGSGDSSSGGGDGGESPPVIVKDLAATYAGRDVGAFVRDALAGKPAHKVDDTVRRLQGTDIDCVDDLQALAETMRSAERMSGWLHVNTGIPEVTAMRFALPFFR